jgi:prepilin-type N-terminal cleavage/methylation domain-containing protein
MKRRGEPGFTLIELVLALSIVAVLVTMLFSGLQVGLRAWQRGEERAAALQHARSMAQLLETSLGGAYWYVGKAAQGDASPILLFKGEAERLSFVTVAPPLPLPPPILFVAVTLSMDAGDAPGLAIREKALPNFDPFEPVAPSVVDPTIASVRFRYMRSGGGWEDIWDSVEENTLPQAIEVTLTPADEARAQIPQPIVLTVPIRVNAL